MALTDGLASAGLGKAVLGVGAASLLGIYADLAYNAFSATNSSPQTTELFAKDRSETLWRYVRLGHVQVFGFAGAASVLLWISGQRSLAVWPLIGAGTVAACMHAMYASALKKGGGTKPGKS